MAQEYDIVDKIDRGTAELLQSNPDAILAFGETDIYRLEPREDGDD
jgi:hypothetical protein